MNNNKIFI